MDKVKCYGCGRHYEPTSDNTREHTHHLGPLPEGVPAAVTKARLAEWLDECQRERDEALRDAERCWETRGS